ncbi:MAG TPA: hypothetical protein VME22_19270 [Solirubrobacteraceae bacterium]|nr:hypothetical protein [Solirubrobacteraceae bacterium]
MRLQLVADRAATRRIRLQGSLASISIGTPCIVAMLNDYNVLLCGSGAVTGRRL